MYWRLPTGKTTVGDREVDLVGAGGPALVVAQGLLGIRAETLRCRNLAAVKQVTSCSDLKRELKRTPQEINQNSRIEAPAYMK